MECDAASLLLSSVRADDVEEEEGSPLTAASSERDVYSSDSLPVSCIGWKLGAEESVSIDSLTGSRAIVSVCECESGALLLLLLLEGESIELAEGDGEEEEEEEEEEEVADT